MMPFFSIVMPSYLGDYPNAAKDRDKKIVRAINNIRAQVFENWELIIVADGCKKTADIVAYLLKARYGNDPRIRCVQINKQPVWSGHPRNVGHNNAKGKYITYCDIDDAFGRSHLRILHDEILKHPKADWFFYNDFLALDDKGAVRERKCSLNRGHCGTSNVTFRADISVVWKDNTYLHDYRFIRSLRQYRMQRIATPEYIVCHIPKILDL